MWVARVNAVKESTCFPVVYAKMPFPTGERDWKCCPETLCCVTHTQSVALLLPWLNSPVQQCPRETAMQHWSLVQAKGTELQSIELSSGWSGLERPVSCPWGSSPVLASCSECGWERLNNTPPWGETGPQSPGKMLSWKTVWQPRAEHLKACAPRVVHDVEWQIVRNWEFKSWQEEQTLLRKTKWIEFDCESCSMKNVFWIL